jgi:hypothetical protein
VRRMSGDSAERLVVFGLRVLAASFAVVGLLFIIAPDGVLGALDDVGDWLPLWAFAPAPETAQQLWLGLGFAYMIVIAGICLVAQADVIRYRPLLLVLAAGKVASSLAGLGFYVFDANVFAYLLNFVVDGGLVVVALWLWALAGRVPEPAAPS